MRSAIMERVEDFLLKDDSSLLGLLESAASKYGFAQRYEQQTEAWEREITLLKQAFRELQEKTGNLHQWKVLLEYEIPRRQQRIDAVILAGDLIFVIEFKTGEAVSRADFWQVESYALDLRDFHGGCKDRCLIPILVGNGRPNAAVQGAENVNRDVADVLFSCPETLASTIDAARRKCRSRNTAELLMSEWCDAPYRPALSIIEAAEHLFANHTVREISHAYADNLTVTSDALVEAIRYSQVNRIRTICFVTGIPGAGKTLTGLNAAHDRSLRADGRPSSVFLSGNGPLVKIVREAIVRNQNRSGQTRRHAEREVKTFIQNVHSFLVHYGIKHPEAPPHEHAIIFDEAQRAWDNVQVKKKHGVNASEAELVLNIMGRCPDWATIVALIGNGQEIHRGEAGLAAWGQALSKLQVPWRVIAAPAVLSQNEHAGGPFSTGKPPFVQDHADERMHLGTTVRSPRAQRFSVWVDRLLEGNVEAASAAIPDAREFPVHITRDLDRAREWLRDRCRSDRRAGLLASSGAVRLRAFGLELSSAFRRGYSFEDWFLCGADDVRSSNQLEVAATEFESQGLEIDWAAVCWGEDFLRHPQSDSWRCRVFRGTRWQNVKPGSTRQQIVNKYRVLLTRAREGLIIWVPRGAAHDVTSSAADLDAIAETLLAAGVKSL